MAGGQVTDTKPQMNGEVFLEIMTIFIIYGTENEECKHRYLAIGNECNNKYKNKIDKAMEARELSKRIYEIVVEEVERTYPQFMKRVNNIDLDYFEDIVRDSEEMPKELNFELREKVLDDVKQYAMQLLEESNIKRRIDAIMKDVDADTAREAFEQAKELIRSYVYASSIINGSSDVTEEELQKMYTDAKKRDLWERITRNNKSDVIEFHHALMDKTYEQCKDVLYESIESFLF